MDTYRKIISYTKQKLAHPGVIKHSRNMSWMFFARASTMIITFMATAYIARNLGPTNYGELSYAVSFVSLFSFIAALGIDQIIYRDVIKYPEKRNEYLGSAIGIRVVSSIVAVIICFLSAVVISGKDVSLFLIFIISLSPLFGAFQLLSYEFLADTKSKYPSILVISVVFILNILKILVIVFDEGVIYLAVVMLIEPILYSLGYIYIKKLLYNDVKLLRFNKVIAISILKDSFPLIFASAFFVIYTRIDQVMIKNMINAEAVGLYDAAVRISEFSYFIPQIFLSAFLPPILNAKKISEKLYFKRTKNILLVLLAFSCITALLTTLLSKYLILIIFGAGFLGALPVLYIYVWSNIGAVLNMLLQQILIAENMGKTVSVTTFFGMITNIVLNIILIPHYGISGAAFATLISYMVPFLSIFFFKKTRHLILQVLKA